jgi:hypothetical protein
MASRRSHRQLEATAYHEAGHAVVAFWKSIGARYATIKRKPDALGHVGLRCPKWFRLDLELNGRMRLLAEGWIMMSCAGQIAEARFLGRRPRYGTYVDNGHTADMALTICGGYGEHTDAYLKYCFLAARFLVNFHWPEVEAVAAALMEHETLSGAQVWEVIRHAARP